MVRIDTSGRSKVVIRRFSVYKTLVCTLLASGLIEPAAAEAATTRTRVIAGRRAVVCDERLSVLRSRPDVGAPLVQRLRRGRAIGIVGALRGREGHLFLRVVVTRRTSGWILADAVIRSGLLADGERMIRLIEEESDGFVKAKLAGICAAEFRGTSVAPRALMLLGESARGVAEQVTRLAQRRIKTALPNRSLLMLHDIGLDRYSRIGIRFTMDGSGERLLYDGGAYREVLRRYPRSPEAGLARERLGF